MRALFEATSAQVIGLKTVPLAAGDQFLVFPSGNLGMGGASIALEDRLADPFSNPATGTRAAGSRVFTVPTFYSVSDDNGGARMMPIGAHMRGDTWFGGGMVALQDYRLGLVGRLPGDREIEVALVRSHSEMTHDVTSVTWELTDSANWLWTPTVDEEEHRSITKTWARAPAIGSPWTPGAGTQARRSR